MYLFINTYKYDYLNEGHKTIELYIYRSFSRFFLQVKNILSYNCIRKLNIIQRNMESRSAEIRSHIVIRRTFRVYSLCVLPPSAPASWSGQNDVHFIPSILLHCRPPCTKSILITCCIQILVTCCIRIMSSCFYVS